MKNLSAMPTRPSVSGRFFIVTRSSVECFSVTGLSRSRACIADRDARPAKAFFRGLPSAAILDAEPMEVPDSVEDLKAEVEKVRGQA